MGQHVLEISLDEEQYSRLASAARERGVSVSTVVREAVDRVIVDPPVACLRRAAGVRLLEAPDMSVPAASGLRDELDAIRAGGVEQSLPQHPST